MKNFVRILSLTLVAVMLAVTLVSCGAPAKTAADAKLALEEEGYTVVNDTVAAPLLFKASSITCTSKVTGVKLVEDEEGNKKKRKKKDKDAEVEESESDSDAAAESEEEKTEE